MSRETKEEKIFSENIDRILAGKPVDVESADSDLLSAIEFAGKMKTLRMTPSESFKADLKAKLLVQLRDKERNSEHSSWFQRIFSQRLAWQIGTTIAVILIAVGITWRAGVFQSTERDNVTAMPPKAAGGVESTQRTAALTTSADSSPAATTSTLAAVPSFSGSNNLAVQVAAVPDKPSYTQGETVNIGVSLTNNLASTLEIKPYPLVVTVTDSNGNIVFTSRPGDEIGTILPGETADFNVKWENQTNSNNNKVALPGKYYITLGKVSNTGSVAQIDMNSVSNFEIIP